MSKGPCGIDEPPQGSFYSVRIPNRYFVSLVSMTLPTSAPLFAENIRLTLNRALSEHMEKSTGTATLASVPGAISPTLIGSRPITLGWHVPSPLDCVSEKMLI
jgi:hypothetical protein